MQRRKPASHTASRVVGALIICLWFASPVWSDADKDRKNAAKSLAKEIVQAQFHKVYVPDFLDPSGVRTEKGCYFASVFSTNLAKDARGFEVVNRNRAQKYLTELHISPQDLQKPDLLSKAVLALGADAVLVGSATFSPKDVKLLLSLRDATTGREVHAMDYREQLDPRFDSGFPAVEDLSTHIYYFPGLDGVSIPKCIHCPDPHYTDEARAAKIQGTILLSVALDENGTIIDVRVVRTPHEDLARRSLIVVRKWRMQPSHDMNGSPVPVRVPIEIGFKLLC